MKKLFLVILALLSTVAGYATDPYFLFSPKGVAQVEIKMLNGKNFWDIWVSSGEFVNGNFIANEAEKLEATMWIKNSTNPSSSYIDSELETTGIKVLIRGRGNTSFHNDKRSYSIELVEDNKDINNEYIEKPKPLLGMSNHDEWALMSMWIDKSFFRIPLAFWLGQKMTGIDYTPQLRFVEVTFVNNDGSRDYRGLFALSEKVARSNDRIDVKKLTTDVADQVEPRVSGGYILEVVPNDKMKKQTEWDKCFLIPGWESDTWHHYVFQYPNSKNITDTQRNYMIQYMTDVYDNLYGDNFTDTINGYVNYIDENSFIDWAILHDLSKGTDNLFHASIFMQKDRGEKLRMTFPWDFDLSFGNVGEDNGCYYEDGFHIRQTKYFDRLWQDPRFYKKLKARYDSLMPLFDLVPYVLQENYNFLDSLGVLDREYNRFGANCLAAYNPLDDKNTVSTYKGHVRYLTEWFKSRQAWLYYHLGETPEERCERMANVPPTIRVTQPENLESCSPSETRVMRGNDEFGYYDYVWIKGDLGESTYGGETYRIYRDNGEYTVQLKDETTGCLSAVSEPVSYCTVPVYSKPAIPLIPNPESQPPRIPEPNATANINADNILIYPNPAHDYVFINADENVFVEIFDIKGVKLKETQEDYLNVSDISRGIYFVKLTGAKNTIVKKLIIH